MKRAGEKRGRGMELLLCLTAATIGLLLCSQSSPLYPMNTWNDANCLLTVGRMMKAGSVLYRDVYEQKGPLLYLYHMLAAMIDDRSFFGVWIMEVLSLTAALYAGVRLLRLRMERAAACAWMMLYAAAVLTCHAFMQGDSAEEFCLPYLMAALYIAVRVYGGGEESAGAGPMAALGALAGCVAMMKFTVLGAFAGLCLVQGVTDLRRKGLGAALKSAGAFLGGMALPIVPWIVHFAAQGALDDAYTAYLHNNIFLYEAAGTTWMTRLGAMLTAGRQNLCWALPAAAGVVMTACSAKERAPLRAAAAAMALSSAGAVFLLGRVWPYCALVLSPFAVLFARAVTPPGRGRRPGGCVAAAAAAGLCICTVLSPNAYLRGMKRDELAQAKLVRQMEPGASLLQYTHLDDGFYLTAGVLPKERFFCLLNVGYTQMREELDRYVREGLPQYVVTSWRELPPEFDRYALCASETGFDDSGRANKTFYLYRRIEP